MRHGLRLDLLTLLLCLSCAPALANAPRLGQVESLLGPHYRPEQRYPLSLQVHGGVRGFDGTLELSWEQVKLTRRLRIGPGVTQRIWFYPVANRATLKARLRLRSSDGTQLASQDWKQYADKRYPIEQLVGLLGPAAGQMDYFRKVDSPNPQAALKFVELRRLPDRAAGLAALDLLIVGDGAGTITPTKKGSQALRDWLALGGGLIVSSLQIGRLAWIRPLLGDAPLEQRAWPLEARWFDKYLAEFRFGCGRGLLCRDDLFHDDLPGRGVARLWRVIETRLLAAGRRPVSPGEFRGAERYFPPAGHLPAVTDATHRFVWGGLGLLLLGASLLLCFSNRPRLYAAAFAAALSLGGSLYLSARRIPPGSIGQQSIGLLELAAAQPEGRLQRWTRLSALRPFEGELTIDSVAPPRLLGLPQWQMISDGARTRRFPLSLGRGAYRDLTRAEVSTAVGPLRLTEQSGLPPHLVNGSASVTLRSVAINDGKRLRLYGDLEPLDALLLSDKRGKSITLEDLAAQLFPESPMPLRTLRFLLQARRLAGRRFILARIDLPAPASKDPAVIPAGVTRVLVVLPY